MAGARPGERLRDPVLYGAPHELGVILEMELLQNAGAVGSDRGRPWMQALGDFCDGLP